MTEPTPSPSGDSRYFDFDAAFAEQKPIPFKLLGRVWELPASVPAATILRMQRLMLMLMRIEQEGDVPDDFVVDEELSYERMAREMVGDDLVDEWVKLGIKYDMLQAVTQRLYAIHTGADPDAKPTGKARPPKKKGSSPRKR